MAGPGCDEYTSVEASCHIFVHMSNRCQHRLIVHWLTYQSIVWSTLLLIGRYQSRKHSPSTRHFLSVLTNNTFITLYKTPKALETTFMGIEDHIWHSSSFRPIWEFWSAMKSKWNVVHLCSQFGQKSQKIHALTPKHFQHVHINYVSSLHTVWHENLLQTLSKSLCVDVKKCNLPRQIKLSLPTNKITSQCRIKTFDNFIIVSVREVQIGPQEPKIT